MMDFSIFIPVTPQPWRRTLGSGRRRYTDPKSRAYKEEIAAVVKRPLVGSSAPFDCSIELSEMIFCMPIPKSWSKKKKANPPPHTSTPDLDNLTKAIGDALNGVLWKDDAQINVINSKKQYAENPGILFSCKICVD